MIRYHFNVITNGIREKVHINANNPGAAYSKCKRLYPFAQKIHLVRSERIRDQDHRESTWLF